MAQKLHPICVKGSGFSNQELAQQILGLRFDALVEFHQAMIHELQQQENNDRLRERNQLAGLLSEIRACETRISQLYQKAWDLCRPHMSDELKVYPEVEV